jgi:hypothetical protein
MENHCWFVTDLIYEQKPTSKRDLIVSFRSLNENEPKIADIYTTYPLLLPSYPIPKRSELFNILSTIKDLPLEAKKVYLNPKNFENINLSYLRDFYGVELEFIQEENCNFAVVQVSLPNDPQLIRALPSTKISGFQTENLTKPVKRHLNLLNRKVTLDEKLENIFIKKDEITDLETEIIYLIDNLPEGDKPHLIRQQLFEFFSEYNGDFMLESILNLAKNKNFLHIVSYLNSYNPNTILDLEKKIIKNISEISSLIKQVDESNFISIDDKNFVYKIHLQYSKKNKTASNPLGVKGISFHEHLFEELSKQRRLFYDIEKPLWKKKHEKVLYKRRETLLKFKNSQEYKDAESQLRINDLIKDLEERLTYETRGMKFPLYEESYDAKISNLTLLVKKEDNSLIRQYHKINYNRGVKPNVPDYEIFNHQDQRALVNEFYYQVRKLKPYDFSNHVITYDIIQIRDAFLENKLGRKFEIGTEAQNPRRDVVKKVYQRLKIPGHEVRDTHRHTFNAFPYLKSKFGSSHKLEDVTRFVRGLREIERDFKKIATHEQLRDLMLLAMSGDENAELELDEYTIADVEEPLRDIVEYGLFDDILFKIKRFMPHISITEIMFSPTIMGELHKTIHFHKFHNERYSGRDEKIRRDEKKIFDKRYLILKKRFLTQNGVEFRYENDENVTQVYMPVELWLKDFLISIYPPWRSYFDNLSRHPIERVAMLQYPKYFLKDPEIDDYFYIRDKTLYKNGLIKIDLINRDTKKLFSGLEAKIINSGKENLLDAYEKSFYHLKDHYRSIYEKLSKTIKKLIRIKPWHLYLDQEEVQSELPGLEFNLFVYDNLDLIKIRDLPDIIKKNLDEEILTLLKRFNSTFNTLNRISLDLESLIGEELLSLFRGGSNFPYLLNQRRKIVSRMKRFQLFYGQNIEDFNSLFNEAFSNLSQELISNHIQVLNLEGDYLFVKGKLPENSMLIPIREIPRFIVKRNEECEESAEPSIFKVPQDSPA